MKEFSLTVSSPDGNIFSGKAVFLSLRGADGDLAVLADHAPFVTSVQPCICCFELQDGTEKALRIGGGLLTNKQKQAIRAADCLPSLKLILLKSFSFYKCLFH